jgi:hypothetical protein
MLRRVDLSQIEKPLYIEAANSNLEVTGEQIDQAYIEYEIEDEDSHAGDAEGLLDVNYGDTISIKVKPELEFGTKKTVYLRLPEKDERHLNVKTGNGRIRLQRLRGFLEASVSNGRVQMKNLEASISASCANGSIEGEKLKAHLDLSTSNGRVTIKESTIRGGSIKSGNGRISLQFSPGAVGAAATAPSASAPDETRPDGTGTLSLFSGNGRVRLALADEGGYRIRVQTKGRLYNHLDNYSIQTDQDATVLVKGNADFSILIQNYKGGVTLVKFEDFDKMFDEGPWFEGWEGCDGPDEFFRNVFSQVDPEKWGQDIAREFEHEIPRFVDKMARFGKRFGKMGEEISRQFHESQSKSEEEVTMILEMLKDGKITAEEAERLINAIKERRS